MKQKAIQYMAKNEQFILDLQNKENHNQACQQEYHQKYLDL